MTDWAPAAVYGLCLATSAICALLLVRTWLRNRTRLLLWTAISFGFLALNNLFLVADMVVFQSADLWIWRQLASGAALTTLLGAFVWEAR